MPFKTYPSLAIVFCVIACSPEQVLMTPEKPRAVRTIVAETATPSVTRSFPAVLEPGEITPLAFDVSGRLGTLDLQIGQFVSAGDILATVEQQDAGLRTEEARATVLEAESVALNAREDADRQEYLYARGVVTAVVRDRAFSQAEQAEARLIQARRNLDLVEESLNDTALRSPFDGVVDTINAQAFGSIQAGQPVVTLYEEDQLQATFLVSYDVVTKLSLGQEVQVLPTDGDETPLSARITEIAQRAPSVASFPVVVALDQGQVKVRSGMAVEILVDIHVPGELRGIPLPISALALQLPAHISEVPREAKVFVWREVANGEGTVEPVDVTITSVSGDHFFVSRGLSPGDRIVTAGVTFLIPGQPATLEGPAIEAAR